MGAASDIDPFSSAVDLAAAVRRRDVSPVELVDLYLERIDRLDPEINAFCFRADDEVRAAAQVAADAVVAADDVDALAPFHGVPLPIKDLNDVAGWPTSHGSRAMDPAPKATSQAVPQRLADAGFVFLGKTATPELGAISHTESDALGDTRNPWNLGHTPGGSSGGAGAALAAGLAPIVHGSDGGGSIRIPASCCGLLGLKPTRGRITDTVVEIEGLATQGVLARTTADLAAGLDVLAVHDPTAWWSPPSPASSLTAALGEAAPSGLRVGSIAAAPGDMVPVDPACAAAVGQVLDALASAGHHITDAALDMAEPDELIAAFGSMWNIGTAGMPLVDETKLEPHNQAMRAAARSTDSITYLESVQTAQRLSQRIVASFVERVDLFVTPTMACLPPEVGAWRVGMDIDPMMAVINVFPMAAFTSIFNVTGLPAISVPVAVDEGSGLPIGVQIVAAPWREDLLVQVAAQLEATFAWADRRPVTV